MNADVRTLVDALRRVADRNDAGFSYAGEEGTSFESFHDLHAAALHVARCLQAIGLRKGDRIAVMLREQRQFIDHFFGSLLAGVVPVPIFTPTVRLDEDEAALRHVVPILLKAGVRCLLGDAFLLSHLDHLPDALSHVNLLTPERLVDLGSGGPGLEVTIDAGDTAFLQFTSGSTSQPKGVRLTHANLIANVRAIAEHGLQAKADDYCVSWLPLYHDMGLIGKVLVPLYAGMRGVLFMPTGAFMKRPLSWLRSISQHQGTITFAPNFAYYLCVARARTRSFEGLDLSTLRIAGCGAEPIRHDVLSEFARVFEPSGFRSQALMPCYGLAEHTLAVTFSPLGAGVAVDSVRTEALKHGWALPPTNRSSIPAAAGGSVTHLVSCGRAFPGHEIRIIDEMGRTLEERAVGEIVARGPSVALGYFDDHEGTRACVRDGWLHTGDLGYIADGSLYVCGRTKDLIIVQGRNFHPHDIEWEASRIDGLRPGHVIAFGIDDQALGRERVIVAAETRLPKPGHGDLQRAIKTRLLEALSLMVDEVVLLPLNALPRTSSGKLRRTQARELFKQAVLQPHRAAPDLAPGLQT